MSRLGNSLGGSASRWFVSTRGFSSVLALLLALTYTKLLGLEKRSVLAFIMVSALILTILLTSGLSLALRNNPRSAIKDEEFIGYIVLVLGASILVGSINCVLLSVYSNLKAEIPLPIFIVCFVYSSLACFTLGLQDALLANSNLKIATIFDLITILIQIITLVFLVNISQTSLIISVFISFIFSYSLISFATLTIFLIGTPIEKSLLIGGMQSILTESKGHQFFAVANGLIDRVDRFMIGLILPIAYLAKYALLSSIVSFARFLPDSAIKLYLFKHHQSEERFRIDYSIRTVGFIAICGVLFIVISQGFILVVFGSDWLLPTSVGALLVVQEILRGNYQLSAMRLIAAGKTSEISRISGVLIFTSISLIVMAVHVFGVWGAPSAMVVTYLITTVLVEKKLKEISNDN